MTSATLPLPRGDAPSLTARALGNVLVLSGLAAAAVAGIVLVALDGWSYYFEPAGVRGYNDLHRLLRPSGALGQPFGMVGFLLMLVPVAYALRKKIARLRNVGSMKTWLEIHIFCGLVGPVFVTFHTSFRFNGVVSVAYWTMLVVVLSGFVGRYLYVRIPRSMRGIEMSRAELDKRAEELSQRLARANLPKRIISKIGAFERSAVPASEAATSFAGLFFGELRVRRELAMLDGEIEATRLAPELLHEIAAVITERATLLRRAVYLEKTKRAFHLWHVFHMPLVYVMFGIVVLHVAVTLYMGYVPFDW
jgi:hypothetical protein